MDNCIKANGLQTVKIKVSYPLTIDILGWLLSCFGRLSCVLQACTTGFLEAFLSSTH